MKRCEGCDRPIDDDKGYYVADNLDRDGFVCLCSKACVKRHEVLRLQIDITKNVKERSNL